QNHFPGDTEDHNIYTKFAELANTFKTHSIGINASHLLIYLDLNSDGQPDDPNEIDFASANLVDLNNDPIETIEDLDLVIAEFLTLINERAALSTTMSEGLNRVVTAYNN